MIKQPYCSYAIELSIESISDDFITIPEANSINQSFDDCIRAKNNNSPKRDPEVIKAEVIKFIRNFKI